MICCSCGKEIYINYGREYWNGIYCKKCADEMLSTPEDTKKYKKIIADLQAENASLRARLDKAVELKEPDLELNPYTGDWELRYQEVVTKVKVYDEREEAEVRLAKLKGEKK